MAVAIGVGTGAPTPHTWRLPLPLPSYPQLVRRSEGWLAAHWPRRQDLHAYLSPDAPAMAVCALLAALGLVQADRTPFAATVWCAATLPGSWQPVLTTEGGRRALVDAAGRGDCPATLPAGWRGPTARRWWPLMGSPTLGPGLVAPDTPPHAWAACAHRAAQHLWQQHPDGGIILQGPPAAVVGVVSALAPTTAVRLITRPVRQMIQPILLPAVAVS